MVFGSEPKSLCLEVTLVPCISLGFIRKLWMVLFWEARQPPSKSKLQEPVVHLFRIYASGATGLENLPVSNGQLGVFHSCFEVCGAFVLYYNFDVFHTDPRNSSNRFLKSKVLDPSKVGYEQYSLLYNQVAACYCDTVCYLSGWEMPFVGQQWQADKQGLLQEAVSRILWVQECMRVVLTCFTHIVVISHFPLVSFVPSMLYRKTSEDAHILCHWFSPHDPKWWSQNELSSGMFSISWGNLQFQ